VGSVFVVSGIAKIIDPYGFIYKIEQYLSVWGLTDVVPHGVVIMGSFLLSAFEFVVGFLIATGSLRRVAPWCAAAMMALMLPLTLYIAIVNPVEDCGCFGDLWVISNTATFLKNVVITAAVVVLIIYNRRCHGLFPPMVQWIQIAIAAAYVIFIGLVGYNEQPLIDFRPYAVGETLVDYDSAPTPTYIYADAQGHEQEFAADELPDEADGWQFVRRVEPTVPVWGKNLVVTDDDGDDVTDEVIGATDHQLLVLIPDLRRAGLSGSFAINELCDYMTRHYGPESFLCLTDADAEERAPYADLTMSAYPMYRAEATAIKAVARGSVAVVCLRNDTVQWKRTLSSVNLDMLSNPHASIDTVYATHGPERFKAYTLLVVAAEAILLMLALLYRFHRFRKKKTVK
jgi:uncharacterized membrane protein YphA (DoxX/SURF4 family)